MDFPASKSPCVQNVPLSKLSQRQFREIRLQHHCFPVQLPYCEIGTQAVYTERTQHCGCRVCQQYLLCLPLCTYGANSLEKGIKIMQAQVSAFFIKTHQYLPPHGVCCQRAGGYLRQIRLEMHIDPAVFHIYNRVLPIVYIIRHRQKLPHTVKPAVVGHRVASHKMYAGHCRTQDDFHTFHYFFIFIARRNRFFSVLSEILYCFQDTSHGRKQTQPRRSTRSFSFRTSVRGNM